MKDKLVKKSDRVMCNVYLDNDVVGFIDMVAKRLHTSRAFAVKYIIRSINKAEFINNMLLKDIPVKLYCHTCNKYISFTVYLDNSEKLDILDNFVYKHRLEFNNKHEIELRRDTYGKR